MTRRYRSVYEDGGLFEFDVYPGVEDALDGTPVLDIKPVFRWSVPRGEVRAPAWSEELGENYF